MALLSTNDWTRRDCPHAVQPSCAQLLLLYGLCGMLAARAAVSACMPSTAARLSTYMLQSCCHSSLVNLGALAERTVIQPASHHWLSFHMLCSHLCDRPTRQAVCSTAWRLCGTPSPPTCADPTWYAALGTWCWQLLVAASMPLTYILFWHSLLLWQPTALFGSTALAVRQPIDAAAMVMLCV
eukprot:scaffold13247_cov62-Phaeocystis_antarctica.AAC.1